MILKICLTCEKSFEVRNYREKSARFCSQHCYKFNQRGSKNIDHICRHCSKTFQDSPCRKRIYCSKSCVNKCQKQTFSPKYSTVRKMMLRRGLVEKCEKCSYNEFPGILGVHHKDGNRKKSKKR